VLILTASLETGMLDQMAEADVDGVLDKTQSLAEIATEVRRLSEGCSASRLCGSCPGGS
jgi:hypothetical protein